MYKNFYNKILENKNHISFHTPGHNGVNLDNELFSNAPFDITEIAYSDNLLNPENIIKNSEEEFAKIYNKDYALMLTQGGTIAVHIALSIISHYGKNVLISKNCHKSIYSKSREIGINLDIVNADYKEKVDSGNYSAIIISNPDYYGNYKDYEEIINYAKNKGLITVLDFCHGSHYVYSNNLPNANIKNYNLVIASLHKTLPCYTGSSLLLCDNNYYNLACYYRLTLHSTSPNYINLLSMDYAKNYFINNGQALYDNVIKAINNFKKEIKGPYSVVENDDTTRLVIDCGDNSGHEVQEKLEKYNIYAEMAIDNKVVFIVTPFNYKHLEYLCDVLPNLIINSKAYKVKEVEFTRKILIKDNSRIKEEIEFIALDNLKNRNLATEIGIYPPGTIILKYGDKIDNEKYSYLINNKKHLTGLVNNLVPVIK